MDRLRIEFEWENPCNARGDELAATWARLEIRAGDVAITKALDLRARGVREGIYLPLYPLAEWIATHWWSLTEELQTPTNRARAWKGRHDLFAAREGFDLPHLVLEPAGTHVQVTWSVPDAVRSSVQFLNEGTTSVRHDDVVHELRVFTDAVVARLRESGITPTLLEEEWTAIAETDEDEVEFCRAAGALGRDPYDLPEPLAESIVYVAARVPHGNLQEFLAVAQEDELRAQADAVAAFFEDAEKNAAYSSRFPELRGRLRSESQAPPWEEGYALARRLRAATDCDDTIFRDSTSLAAPFGVDPETWRRHTVRAYAGLDFLDAAYAGGNGDSPRFALRGGQRMFALGRAIGSYLGSEAASGLVTSSTSDDQKRNRAFSAELLAPARLIRGRLSSALVREEELDEIASDFGVSPLMIRHQIENHELAEISRW